MSRTPIPKWLLSTLQRKISGEPKPDTQDYQVAAAALAGVEQDDLKSRFKIESAEILQSIRRVACQVRAGETPDETLEEFPELRALDKKKSERKRGKKKDAEEAIIRLEDINLDGLPVIDHDDPGSLPEFLRVVKERHAATLAPLTMTMLEAKVAFGSDVALKNSLELLYGIGKRGPMVAIQNNLGGGDRPASARGPHEFESIIMEAEKQDGTTGGETTVFDERLLEQQESE